MQAAHHSPAHLQWLTTHANELLDFGTSTPRPTGGAYWLDADGNPDPSHPIYTWITSRMVHVYSLGVIQGRPGSREIAEQVMSALLPGGILYDSQHGGWHHGIGQGSSAAEPKACYDHAFVVLAATSAVQAGLDRGDELLEAATDVFENRFWDEQAGLFVDTWNADFSQLDEYRGINSNMHSVEALLSLAGIGEADKWLGRALRICRFVVDMAQSHGWRLPEHYDAQWQPILDLNADNPNDQFKPYGATVGHGLEWARLLVQLEAGLAASGQEPEPWLAEAAVAMFDRAVADGWSVDGKPGFVYTTDWSGKPVVRDRMHWVVAEAINTAAALHARTGDAAYGQWYSTWWDHARELFIDSERGSWHHQLDENNVITDTVWPGKPDLYHTYQATLLPSLPLYPMFSTELARRAAEVPILVIGEALIDEVHHTDGRREEHPGGSPANVAITLGRLGRRPTLLTQLGNDAAGESIAQWLAASHVRLDPRSLPDAGGPAAVDHRATRTSRATATLDATGAATYTFDLNWDVADPKPVTADVIHIGSISATLQPGAARIRALVAGTEALVTYDPNIRPNLIDDPDATRASVAELVSSADVVKVSDEDLAWLYPNADPAAAARTWLGTGPAVVLVTQGGDGVSVIAAGFEFTLPSMRVEVVDTVGAGDTLMGALIDGMLTALGGGAGAAAGTGTAGAEHAAGGAAAPVVSKGAVRGLSEAQWRQILARAIQAAAITVSRAGANPPWSTELPA